MTDDRNVQHQDINDELFTTFEPEEELWMMGGSKSQSGPRGTDGTGTDTDLDFAAI